MKLIEYFLKFGFMFFLSLVMMVYGGPSFFKKIASDQTNFRKLDNITELKINYIYNSENYIQFSLITNSNDTLIKNFFVPEKEYIGIEVFLFKNQFIQSKELLEFLPFDLKTNELKKFKQIKYQLINNNIESLSIKDQYLIGKKTTNFKIAIYYLCGSLVSFAGLLGFLLSFTTFIHCIKTYQKTGVFPSLPNSINSKLDGLKYIFRGLNANPRSSKSPDFEDD